MCIILEDRSFGGCTKKEDQENAKSIKGSG